MSKRALTGMAVLGLLLGANLVWWVWSGWGLISVDADNKPVTDVVHSIERQAGVRLVSNLPADQTISMHVHKVSLLRALQVLSNNSNSSWEVAHVAAPDKGSIEAAVASFESGDMANWKIFALPSGPMGMMGGGMVDPRDERLEIPAAEEGTLHAYIQSASQRVDGQFWVPADWDPPVAGPPGADRVGDVVAELAGDAGGRSAEIILLSARGQFGGPPGPASTGGPGSSRPGGSDGGPTFDAAAMEQRALARIEAMPSAQREQARAEFEERRKFFEEISGLPEDQRREAIRERMENAGPEERERMENRMARMGASRTVEQRNEFFRRVVEFREAARDNE